MNEPKTGLPIYKKHTMSEEEKKYDEQWRNEFFGVISEDGDVEGVPVVEGELVVYEIGTP